MRPNLEALRDLLAKAKAAEMGSQELDEVVGAAWWWLDAYSFTARPYDLTGVMGLMPEGWEILETIWGTSDYRFQLMKEQPTGEWVYANGQARNPALALLIALIEAHIYDRNLEGGE